MCDGDEIPKRGHSQVTGLAQHAQQPRFEPGRGTFRFPGEAPPPLPQEDHASRNTGPRPEERRIPFMLLKHGREIPARCLNPLISKGQLEAIRPQTAIHSRKLRKRHLSRRPRFDIHCNKAHIVTEFLGS